MQEVRAALEVADKVDALKDSVGCAARCEGRCRRRHSRCFGDLRGEIHTALVGDPGFFVSFDFLLDPDGALLGIHLQIAFCLQLCFRHGFRHADRGVQNILLAAQPVGVGKGCVCCLVILFLVVSGKRVCCGPTSDRRTMHHKVSYARIFADHKRRF